MDPWIVTPVERARHMEQFRGLNPIDGVITGAQAKGLLLQSGLPPPVLGQIWSLADANCDGKMDINEFSVACKLITMKLRGFEIPGVLPPHLKTVLASSGTTTPLSPAATFGSGMVTPPVRPLVPPPVGAVAMPGMVSMSGMVSPPLQPSIAASSVAQPMVSGMHGQPLVGLSQPLISGLGSQPLVSGIQSFGGGITNPPIVSGVGIVQPMVSGIVAQPLVGGLPPGSVGGGISGIPPGMVATTAVPPASLALRSATPPVSGVRPVAPTHDALHRSTSVTSHDALASPLMEWAVPNASRLKYTQLFNQNDRTKSGYLTGVQARNILLGTGLPQPILAQVWGLSDMDSDGRLGSEEFVLALHLCDLFKQTGRLPPKLTPELIPPSFRVGSRKQSIKSVPGSTVASGQNTGSNTPILDSDPLSPSGNSFEDKRKENFDKGQAELDRRRRILEMERQREREERERKEREEFERREKQRLEQEKRQMEERERQLAMQRDMEERKVAEMMKLEEQKESARREMERQRRLEMDENKRSELLARRQKEQDEVLRLKGVNHGLQLELSQLTDKVKELSGKITETRVGVSSVKTEIDGMRVKRDIFMNDMGTLKGQLKEQNNRMVAAAQEKARIEKLASESEGKQMNLKVLREKLQSMKDELSKKQVESDTAVEEVNELKSNLSTLIESCKVIYEEYKQKRETVMQMRKKHQQEFDYNAAWGSTSEPPKPSVPVINGDDSGYYRALYDFESRNVDELSFPAGAIIQKNVDIVPDPGWLSGTYDGKSGWFPESFVEVLPAEEIPQEESQEVVAQAIPESSDAGEYYIALYPYESEEPGDLPFEAGEMVLVTQSEGEWWTGQIGTDRIGIFPANYVAKQDEVATTEAVETVETVVAEATHVTNNIGYEEQPPVETFVTNDMSAVPEEITKREEPNKTQLEPHEEAEIKREISEIAKMPPQKSPKAGSKRRYEIATVLANYQPTTEGQLTLTRGQLITVRKKSPSGWWEGELQAKGKKRQIGWFPGSYVKVLGPGGGSRQSSSRTTPIPFDEIEMPMMAAPIYTDSKEQVIALYPYTAQNVDELTFGKDDVITIISKDEPDWWKGQLDSAVGLFPTNYVQPISNTQGQEPEFSPSPFGTSKFDDSVFAEDNGEMTDADWPDFPASETTSMMSNSNGNGVQYGNGFDRSFSTEAFNYQASHTHNNNGSGFYVTAEESKRQDSILELITTEENYMSDLGIVKKCFMNPLFQSGLLNEDELHAVFVNWEDLMDGTSKLMKAFAIRKKTCFNGTILMIGDILCQHIPSLNIYIRFCSAQLRSCALIQQKTEKSAEFKEFCKKCQAHPDTLNLPLTSFLIKPMQRITKYPLLIKKIMEYTPENHPDRQNLEEALSKAEELCAQVNEGVREKENSDRLEFLQTHCDCTGLEERLIFNSLTNALGPRKYLHHGVIKKTKSGKELVGFLFNDFLLLAQPNKLLNQDSFSFDRHKSLKFKIYRQPLFLNEILVEEDGMQNENDFAIGVQTNKSGMMYITAPGVSEKRLWINKIKEAKNQYLKTEQQYLQRQRSKKINAVGRLMVMIMEGISLADRDQSVLGRRPKGKLKVVVGSGKSLANRDPNGKSDPYCEVSLGSEIKRTRVIRATLNPKWNDSMQFSVKDLHEDILCVTVYDRDYFAPNQFLGRTEVSISKIMEESRNRKTPLIKKLPLHEVEKGEIVIKFHLQIFE